MRIGVLKEIKQDEYRVALIPEQVKVLFDLGHEVYVEHFAGEAAGFTDNEYIVNGAVSQSKAQVLENAMLLLKVKAPLPSEYKDYQKEHILFTYLHFDENIPKKEILKLISAGFLGIAYEWVEKNGKYPLLEPMSKLTGYLFAQRSYEFLTKYKGKLPGKYEKQHIGSKVLIIGLGTIGLSAINYFMHNGSQIVILDKHIGTINNRLNTRFETENIDYLYQYNIELKAFDSKNPQKTKDDLRNVISEFDIVLNCAVRRDDLSKEKLDYLIDRSMIKQMGKGSVICDTTACDQDLIETCVSSGDINHIDIIDGVVHYNCDHIPSYVANTATILLTEQTFPYVQEIVSKGIKETIEDNVAFRNGVSCYQGYITHLYAAQKKDMMNDYRDIMDLI